MARTTRLAALIFIALSWYAYQFYWDVLFRQTVIIDGSEVSFQRRADGLVEGFVSDDFEFAKLCGYLHAMDRGMQLYITKLTGEGRLSETLKNLPPINKLDTAIRSTGFGKRVSEAAKALSPEARRSLEAYAAGVNAYMDTHTRPWYFFLVGYTPERWRVEDSLYIVKIMSYLGLADVQMDIEKLIMESVQMNSSSFELMQALFGKHLANVPDDVIETIRRVPVVHSALAGATDLITSAAAAAPAAASASSPYKGSNNWAVSASRSKSGSAMYSSDPHLEVNRLPAIWYEVCVHVQPAKGKRGFRSGISIPGVPGLVMGRATDFAFGFTYGFVDAVDYFIEEVRDGKVRRPDDQWELVPTWTEEVKRINDKPLKVYLFETSHGILERENPHDPILKDGLYLARAYNGNSKFSNESHVVEFALNMPQFNDIHEAIEFASSRTSEVSMNGIMADTKGNIAFHQMGAVPIRTAGWSGLWPQLGWTPNVGWLGIRRNRELKKIVNPIEGQLQTANDEHNPQSNENFTAVNFHMGSYRSDRIRNLLAAKTKLDIDDFTSIQADVVSLQAEAFMKILRPLIPQEGNSAAAEALRQWDCRYNAESRAAKLFEEFYWELLSEVFGKRVLGEVNWRHVASRLYLGIGFHYFDDLLFEYSASLDRLLWHGESRNVLFSRVLKTVLARHTHTSTNLKTYGEERSFNMANIFFGDTIPRFLGFSAPAVSVGSRATIVQGQMFKHSWKGKNIQSVMGVSYRFVTDLATQAIHSALPGGSSENRFSPFYKNEVEDWQNIIYKTVDAADHDGRNQQSKKAEL